MRSSQRAGQRSFPPQEWTSANGRREPGGSTLALGAKTNACPTLWPGVPWWPMMALLDNLCLVGFPSARASRIPAPMNHLHLHSVPRSVPGGTQHKIPKNLLYLFFKNSIIPHPSTHPPTGFSNKASLGAPVSGATGRLRN